MPAGNILGIHCKVPYVSNESYYISTAHVVENPKFAFFAHLYPRLRMIADFEVTDTYPNIPTQALRIWASYLKSVNPNLHILFGAVDNPNFKPRYFSQYLNYVMQDALWCANNGIDAYCPINENLISGVHGATLGQPPISMSRLSNVITVTFDYPHGFNTGDYIRVDNVASDASYNVTDSELVETLQCTVIDPYTITYVKNGADGTISEFRSITAFANSTVNPGAKTKVTSAGHGFSNGNIVHITGTTNYNGRYAISNVTTDTFDLDNKVYTSNDATGVATKICLDWSAKEVVRKTIHVVQQVQTVFPREVVCTESQGHFSPWIAEFANLPTSNFKMGWNGYGSGNNEAAFSAWRSEFNTIFATFGNKLIITEHNIVAESPSSVQVGGVTQSHKDFERLATRELIRRFRYAQSAGVEQIYVFGPWGNGINWWIAFNTFCNISPHGWINETKRQLTGNVMPFIYELKEVRSVGAFFGNCTNI